MNIPRFVQVKEGFFIEKEEIGKIYDTTKPFPTHLKYCEYHTWERTFTENSRFFQEITFPAEDLFPIY